MKEILCWLSVGFSLAAICCQGASLYYRRKAMRLQQYIITMRKPNGEKTD